MTVSYLVANVAQLMTLAIIARAILSWFPSVQALAPVTALLTRATDPIIRPIRQRLPTLGGLDLSPLVAILLISIISSLMLSLLAGH